MEHLTKVSFKQKVFDYETDQTWKFKGDKPAIIDFYAEWCGPCKIVSPILDQLAKEYQGKIDIYKVNTEDQLELASVFQISSIPSILFVPKNGEPRMSLGAMSAQGFKQTIKEVLRVN